MDPMILLCIAALALVGGIVLHIANMYGCPEQSCVGTVIRKDSIDGVIQPYGTHDPSDVPHVGPELCQVYIVIPGPQTISPFVDRDTYDALCVSKPARVRYRKGRLTRAVHCLSVEPLPKQLALGET